MQISGRWTLILVGCAAFGLGLLVTALLFLGLGSLGGDALTASSDTAPVSAAAAPTSDSPSDASSEGPPPLPPATGAATASGPAQVACSVRLEPVVGDQPATRLVVEASPDVETLWGVITSGDQQTGGPIYLTAGRGEQIVPGFTAEASEIVVYADPSMSEALEACRS